MRYTFAGAHAPALLPGISRPAFSLSMAPPCFPPDQGPTARSAGPSGLPRRGGTPFSGCCRTVSENRLSAAVIGARKLRELAAADVRLALSKMASEYSSAVVTMGHLALKRTIRHAEANDLVARNVAALVDTPKGQEGRPSESLTLEQAMAVITAAKTLPAMQLRSGLKDVRRPAELMYAYIVLSLLVGVRTEEARALRWDHVNLLGDADTKPPVPPHVAVWRSVRVHGETKTERSRRTLALPRLAVDALRALQDVQAHERTLAGDMW